MGGDETIGDNRRGEIVTETIKYPERGSFDGKHYTDADGRVHVRVDSCLHGCSECSLRDIDCGELDCNGFVFSLVYGARVPVKGNSYLSDDWETTEGEAIRSRIENSGRERDVLEKCDDMLASLQQELRGCCRVKHIREMIDHRLEGLNADGDK